MTDKMREEFEAAYVAKIQEKLGGPIPKSILNEYLECGSDGEYRSFQAAGAWWGWKASRESLVIELPSVCQSDDPFDLKRDIIDELEASGLKVKR